MWLINTTTLELHDFVDHRSAPPYAILSHCWGEGEVSFKDFRKKRNCTGPGYEKLLNACAYARGFTSLETMLDGAAEPETDPGTSELEESVGLRWLWVDTCCIDKRSSSELSEAINSMYTWYKTAVVCFAHLADVSMRSGTVEGWWEQFHKSRWFTRGWTLQELIAPRQVVFVDLDWDYIGLRSKKGLLPGDTLSLIADAIASITKIPPPLLRGSGGLNQYSMAQRMSWASRRSTTREEDAAYCLLGLFGINMPLLYGEGPRAFLRLQHEILRHGLGDSIFAWRPSHGPSAKVYQLFASSPAHFADSADIVDTARKAGPIFTTRGHMVELNIHVPRQKGVYENSKRRRPSDVAQLIVRLACGRWSTTPSDLPMFTPCILLLTQIPGTQYLVRIRGQRHGNYFCEDDVESIGEWEPVSSAGTRFILVHRGDREPWRRTHGSIDVGDTTAARQDVVLNFPLDGIGHGAEANIAEPER